METDVIYRLPSLMLLTTGAADKALDDLLALTIPMMGHHLSYRDAV